MTSEHDAPFDTAENDTLAPSPRRRRHTMTAVALVALLGAGTVACGGDDSANEAGDELAEQLAEAGAGVDDVEIDSESGEVDIETEDGSVSIGSDLPDDFPEDIPLPEDYELISSMGGSSDGEQGWTISGTLPDADEDTFDGLLAAFTDAGFEVTNEMTGESSNGQSSTATLDDGTWSVLLSVQVGVDGADDSFNYIVGTSTGS